MASLFIVITTKNYDNVLQNDDLTKNLAKHNTLNPLDENTETAEVQIQLNPLF